MNLDDLRTLLDYHYWARDRLLTAVDALSAEQFLRPLGSSFSSVRDTLSHTLGAEAFWLMRWNGQSPTQLLPHDRIPDAAALRKEWTELETKVRAYLEGVGDEGLTRVHSFSMIDGRTSSAVFWHMLQHVVNHATYHRGQVVTMIRQLGATPPKSLDLITFYREKSKPKPA